MADGPTIAAIHQRAERWLTDDPWSDDPVQLMRDLLAQLAVLEAQQTAQTWQPIETAPCNGTIVLGWWPDRFTSPWPMWKYADEKKWRSGDDLDEEHESTPTHWMPLPPAPAPQEPTP